MSQPTNSVPPTAVDFSALVRTDADHQIFRPGDTIIAEGEPGDRMFILVEGSVSVSSEGRQVAVLGPGNLFGEMSVINDEARSATVRARSAVKVVAITKKRFLFLTEQTPYFALHVMRLLSERLRRMNRLT